MALAGEYRVTTPVTEIAREALESTCDAVYSCDQDGCVTGWNEAAAELLGYERNDVMQRPCCDVLGGVDLFGNRYCVPLCPLLTMARRRQPIGHFELDVFKKDDTHVRVSVFVVVLFSNGSSEFEIIHLLRPSDRRELPTQPPNDAASLTRREMEVVRLLAEGQDSRQIGQELGVSVSTVRKHVQNLMQKLGVNTRLSAVVTAMNRHLL